MSARAVDVVLECSGKKAGDGGRARRNCAGEEGSCSWAPAWSRPTFDPNRMLLNELEICGSFVYDADGFDRAIELLSSGALPVDALVDPTDVPLDLIGRGARAASPTGASRAR